MRISTLRSCASLLASSAVLLLCACAHEVYSPPAHPIPLEAPRALRQGETAVRIAGGSTSALFGPDLIAGTASVQRGLGHGAEGSLEATVARVQGDSAAGTSPFILAARAGGKLELYGHHLAATAGLGGGGSAGGAFVSPDVGLVLGYDNPYLVPFFSLHGMGSLPVAPKEVDVTVAGDPPGTHVDTPKTTWGAGSAAGVRVPIGHPDHEGVHGGITGGLVSWHLYSDGHDEGFFGPSLSADVVF
jgi:hypothetical protein